MPYQKQVWPDATIQDSLGAKLNHMEQGIFDASSGGGGGGVTICTSSTRPASPVSGQLIYETDTDKTYVYAAGVWEPVSSPTGAAGGMLSGTYPNPNVASISGLAAGGVLSGTYPNPAFASFSSTAVTLPVGTISPYAGSDATTPAGWLFCGGQAVSRSTYADLFTVVSTTYGAGDGSTTFNVPDLRGRVLAGKDNMGGTTASRLTAAGSGITGTTLGANGGTQTHVLTTAQMPSHSHGGATGSAAPNMQLSDGRDLVYTNAAAGTGTFGTAPGASNLRAAPHTHSIGAEGSGGAHQNTQPTIVTNYIIKALADPVNTIGVALAGAAGGGLAGSYPNPTVASVGTAALPAGSVVQVQRHEWGNVTTMSGATWVTCNGSSYTFTPLYATSKLFVFSDISVNSYYPGGGSGGASTRLLWRGSVITTQSASAGHEHYVQAPDNYQRAAKNAVVTAGSGAGALTTQVQAYGATPTVNINQASQWASGYTIIEVKQ